MRAREDPDIPGVIVGTFTLFDIDLYALIDPGFTYSYICMKQMSDKLPSVELLAYDLLVTSPLGHSVRDNRVHKNCPTTRKKVGVDIYYLDLKVTYVNIVNLNEQL